MPSQVFNEFKEEISSGAVDLSSDDLRVLLVMTNTTVDTENSGVSTIADFTTLDEFDGSGYSAGGAALANESVTKDDANSRAELDADDITFSSLGNGTRAIQGALLYVFDTTVNASLPVAYIEFSSTVNPGGSDFTVSWDSEGILHLT